MATDGFGEREVLRAAHCVLLPAIADTTLTPALERFLEAGGISLLLGETRDEYVAREMSVGRIESESAGAIKPLTAEVRGQVGGPALIAVDEEPGGIRRFAHLTGELPTDEGPDRLEAAAADVGRGLVDLGVNVALGPVLDLGGGTTPWLVNRYLSDEVTVVTELGAAFVRGVQNAGVAATAKHFPGHRGLDIDPMVEAGSPVPGGPSKLLVDLQPFAAAVEAGCRCAMVGPGTVTALDPDLPALLSPKVIGLLRGALGFDGVIVSDDLDAAAVMAVGDVESTAVDALAAGNDFLLVSAENDLESLAEAIARAVEKGELEAERLADAAARVRGLASDLDAAVAEIA
jgi:beta-N-acetylhexosaminidase